MSRLGPRGPAALGAEVQLEGALFFPVVRARRRGKRRPDTLAGRVRAFLAARKKPARAREVSRALGITQDEASRTLVHLWKRGHALRVAFATYELKGRP